MATLNKNTFNNRDGKEKQKIRTLIAEAMINSIAPMTKPILTLPSDTLKFEKTLIKRGSSKFKFLACECDEKTYSLMMANIVKSKLATKFDTHFGKLSDMIYKAKENEFSHINADYCGQFNSYYREIEYAMRNNIVCVNGTISVTMNDRISKGCKGYDSENEGIIEMMEAVAPNPNPKANEKTLHVVTEFITRMAGYSYRLEKIKRYHDVDEKTGKTKGNMIMIIVRRIR